MTVALLPSTKTSQGPLLMPSPVLKVIHNCELADDVTNEKSQLSFETYCDTLLHGSGGSSQTHILTVQVSYKVVDFAEQNVR